MKLMSLLTLCALLSASACSHRKSCCTKEQDKVACKDGSCSKKKEETKKSCCTEDHCKKS